MLYFPTIIAEVAAKVSEAMLARQTDPFEVFFEYGLFQEVVKRVYAKDTAATFPLIGLEMPFEEKIDGKLSGCEVTANVFLIMPTDVNWTMAEREANNFFPRLFPIYEEFKKQLSRNVKLNNPRPDQIQHSRRILPYWGGDESGNVNSPNYGTARYVDAVQLRNLKLNVKREALIC